jgi:hypothetical protein
MMSLDSVSKQSAGYLVSQFIQSLPQSFNRDELQLHFRATERGLFCSLPFVGKFITAFDSFEKRARMATGAKSLSDFDDSKAIVSDKSTRRLFGKTDYPLYYVVEGKAALVGVLVESAPGVLQGLGLVPYRGIPLAADSLLHPRDPIFNEGWMSAQVSPRGVIYSIVYMDTADRRCFVEVPDSQFNEWCRDVLGNPKFAERMPHRSIREAAQLLRSLLADSKSLGNQTRVLALRSNACPGLVTRPGASTSTMSAKKHMRIVGGQVVELVATPTPLQDQPSERGLRKECYVLGSRFSMVRNLSFGSLAKELQVINSEARVSPPVSVPPRSAPSKTKLRNGHKNEGKYSPSRRSIDSKKSVVGYKSWIVKKINGSLSLVVIINKDKQVTFSPKLLLEFINLCLGNPACIKALPIVFGLTDLFDFVYSILTSAARVEQRHLHPALAQQKFANDDVLLRRDGWVFRLNGNDGVLRGLYHEVHSLSLASNKDARKQM